MGVREVPLPAPAAGEVRVKMYYAGICASRLNGAMFPQSIDGFSRAADSTAIPFRVAGRGASRVTRRPGRPGRRRVRTTPSSSA